MPIRRTPRSSPPCRRMFSAMDTPPRGAVMLVYLVAICLLIIGPLEVGLYLAQCFQPQHPLPVKIIPLVLEAVPILAGVVILIKAKAIAEWLANKFD